MVRQLQISTKEHGVQPFIPNNGQIEIISSIERQAKANRPVRILVLKARQLGMSTVSAAAMFCRRFLLAHTTGLTIAHESPASEHLHGMARLYWDTWPFNQCYTAKYLSKREIAWRETGSSIRTAVAKNLGAGRARTIHDLHASEVAFWEDPERLWLGLKQTIPSRPGSMIIIESTANGAGGWFSDLWHSSISKDTEFEAMFFPWWRHHEYCASYLEMDSEDLGRLDPEEKFLRAMGVDDDHLQWRRWAIINLAGEDLDGFHQEYPSTAEEAFVASGRPVFPIDKVRDAFQPLTNDAGALISPAQGVMIQDGHGSYKFVSQPNGPLSIYKMPGRDREWSQYFVAGDPCHAAGDDFACIQVINRRTYEQVAVWHGKIDPSHFAHELVKLAVFYNEAELTTEVEGPGYATIGAIMEIGYPYVWRHRNADRVPGKMSQAYGWSTTWKRKDWAIAELGKLILDGSIILHDEGTRDELLSYVMLDSGQFGSYGPADPRGHDDRVMSLAIAVVCSRTEGPLAPYGTHPEQRPPGWMGQVRAILEPEDVYADV